MKKLFIITMMVSFFGINLSAYSGDIQCLSENEIELLNNINKSFMLIREKKAEQGPECKYEQLLNESFSKYPYLPISKLFSNPKKMTVGQALKSSVNMLSSGDYRQLYLRYYESLKARDTYWVASELRGVSHNTDLLDKHLELDGLCFYGSAAYEATKSDVWSDLTNNLGEPTAEDAL